jgi:molybdopterin-binding protein
MPPQDPSNLLTDHPPTRISSPRNRLRGTVLAVTKDGVAARVELACGPYRIVSLMSREAADELDLKPGDETTAIIKSATVFIENH